MESPKRQLRTLTLDQITTRVKERFGPGKDREFFREVERRQWFPGSQVRPKAWIVDDGQSRVTNAADKDGGEEFQQKYKIILDLRDNWEREQPFIDWTDRVQEIVLHLLNWLPTTGVIDHKYEDDEPFDAILASGAVQSIWIISFVVHRFE